ncbi:MAG: LPS-assembly protein LptD, partial [Desulfobulbus sp.]|nr:LPS-assembly protein LptD [Desulfobulbus sp.]
MHHAKTSAPILAWTLFFLTLLFLPPVAQADAVQARQWELNADKLTRHETPPTIIAEGNVILKKQEPATTIKADTVSYDIANSVLTVTGNVLIDVGTDRLVADSGTIDLEKATGTFHNATVVRQDKEIHFEGRVIEKTGALTYHIADGWVITCKLEPGQTPPWSFAAADVDITDGGYAWLTHATFRILDVPVLYTPVMVLPAKRKRQTGMLFPTFSLSDRDGFSLETPFFLNISPSTDLTLYPRYIANRGIMTGAEFRYILDENSKGMLMGNFLNDRLSDPNEVDYYREGHFSHTNSNRYWLRGKADQDIGSWTTRLDLDLVSDLDYLREFDIGSTGFSISQEKFSDAFGRGFIDKTNKYRENTVATLRSWENGTSLLGEAMIINDVSEQIYTDNNPSKAWTLPSLTYSGVLPVTFLNGPDFVWNTNYTNFWRDKGVNAQRIDISPALSTGIPISPYLEAVISGGFRTTSYLIDANGADEWEGKDSENRFLSHFSSELGTTLMRDFAVSLSGGNSLNHTLRPFVGYGHTSIPDRKTLPQFDMTDDLEEENAVYFGINNFFSIAGEKNGREFEREYAFLKAKQGYDLRNEKSNEPLTPVIVETGFYPLQNMRIKYTTHIDVYGDGAFLHSIDSDYYSETG